MKLWKRISMYVFSLSLSFVVSLLRGTSKVTMNTQKRSNRMEHCIEVKWVSATYRCSSTAMSAAPVGRMQRKNPRGQSWANCQDEMESKNSRVKNPELVLKCFEQVLYPRTSTWMLKECPTPCYQPPLQWWLWRLSPSFGYWYSPFRRLSWLPSVPFLFKTSCEVRQPTADFRVLLKVRNFDSFQTLYVYIYKYT